MAKTLILNSEGVAVASYEVTNDGNITITGNNGSTLVLGGDGGVLLEANTMPSPVPDGYTQPSNDAQLHNAKSGANVVAGGDGTVTLQPKEGMPVVSFIAQSDSDPTTSDVQNGTCSIWYNTTTGYAKLWINIGGDLASLSFNFAATESLPAQTEVVGGRPRHLS